MLVSIFTGTFLINLATILHNLGFVQFSENNVPFDLN